MYKSSGKEYVGNNYRWFIMNGIMSWISSISLLSSMEDSDDDDSISIQDILIAATFSSVLALSYVLHRYRNSERLNNAKILNLRKKNRELASKNYNQKQKIETHKQAELEQEMKFKEILAQVILTLTHQHSNLSK